MISKYAFDLTHKNKQFYDLFVFQYCAEQTITNALTLLPEIIKYKK